MAFKMQVGPLRYVIELLAQIVKMLYNLALETGSCPSEMHFANVIAVYKGGDVNNTNNLNRNLICPHRRKVPKKIYIRLSLVLEKPSFLSTVQYGFQKG